MAQYPLGGLTWHYLHYVVGLARLGHDVFYLEDSGKWPYNPIDQAASPDCSYNVGYLSQVMSRFGLADKWAYCFSQDSEWFGLSEAARSDLIASADLLVNVSGTLDRPQDYRQVRRLAYIDTDPVFTQIKLARGQEDLRRRVDSHDVHFSYGERLSEPVPATGHQWRPTRQPVVLSEWMTEAPARDAFTTVMNWTSYNSIEWAGQTYGQKNSEFSRYLELPARVAPSVLELALAAGKTERSPYALLRHKGWHVVDPAEACGDLDAYRNYVASSKAEWAVAKNGYVSGRPGWFSERSACYLAAGRPVVVQDTGFSDTLPVGEGILTFDTVEEAARGIREVEACYERHSRAARDLAEECFDADKILRRLLAEALA